MDESCKDDGSLVKDECAVTCYTGASGDYVGT